MMFFSKSVHFTNPGILFLNSHSSVVCLEHRLIFKEIRNTWDFAISFSSWDCLNLELTEKAGLDEAQVAIKIAGRNNNLRYADETTLMTENEEELKSLLMKVKEENGKSWLKSQHSEN